MLCIIHVPAMFTWHQLHHHQQPWTQYSLLHHIVHSFAHGCAHLLHQKKGPLSNASHDDNKQTSLWIYSNFRLMLLSWQPPMLIVHILINYACMDQIIVMIRTSKKRTFVQAKKKVYICILLWPNNYLKARKYPPVKPTGSPNRRRGNVAPWILVFTSKTGSLYSTLGWQYRDKCCVRD